MSDEIIGFREDVVHLARLGLSGRVQDVQMYLRRLAKRCKESDARLAEQIEGMLRSTPTRSSPLRREESSAAPMPVDLDSRLHLVRFEESPALSTEPVFVETVGRSLQQLVDERRGRQRLESVGLQPSRSAL